MFASTANAQLFERGMDVDGNHTMVYDDEYDLTWLADANYANTSGYNTTGSFPGQEGGAMTWLESTTWANNLVINDEIYGDISGWRLPSAYNAISDPNGDIGPINSSGPTNVYGSELAHMTVLANSVFNVSFADPSITSGLFSNIQSTMYWSGTSTSSENAWMTTFQGEVGFNYVYEMRDNMTSTYAWAVMSGDIAAVPLPAASWLFGPALAWLFSITKTRRRVA